MRRNRRFWCWPRNPTSNAGTDPQARLYSRVAAIQAWCGWPGIAAQAQLCRNGTAGTTLQVWPCRHAQGNRLEKAGAGTSIPKSGVARQSVRRIEVESAARELSDSSCISSNN